MNKLKVIVDQETGQQATDRAQVDAALVRLGTFLTADFPWDWDDDVIGNGLTDMLTGLEKAEDDVNQLQGLIAEMRESVRSIQQDQIAEKTADFRAKAAAWLSSTEDERTSIIEQGMRDGSIPVPANILTM